MRLAYGPGASQFGDFYPGESPARRTTVVVVHGGFWRAHRGLDMTAPLAEGLAQCGWNTWNVEYRRAGQGGRPATLDDCAAAVDHLAVLGGELALDLGLALVLGHSAGGHLAVWSAGRAAVADCPWPGIGEDAVVGFVGDPDEVPDRYRQADPMRRLPTRVTVRCVHSPDDERVPFEQSARYVEAAARAGDDARLVEVDGAHADGIDLRTAAGRRVVSVLEEIDGDRRP